MNADPSFADGRCTCGAVRFRLATPPPIVHCRHCRWCQRKTGASWRATLQARAAPAR